MRRALLLATSLTLLACAGEAPVDEDVAPDAKADSGAPEEASADTGDEPDTFVADSGTADTALPEEAGRDAATDVPDAKPVCTGSQAEPNNTIPSAALLASIDDCDSSGSSFKGVAAGSGDPDFWHYLGSDKFGCSVDPFASTKSPVRLCVFVACSAGTTEVKKCSKGTPATSPGGLPGCCTEGPGDVLVEHSCPLLGTDDGADVFMRVDAPGATTCVPYDVSYHF